MSYRKISSAVLLTLSVCFGQSRYSIADEHAGGPSSPAVIVLRDDVAGLEAAVTPTEGGELSSFRAKVKGEWVELLYHARDYSPGPGFKGKGPLLWPAVGAQYPVGTIPETSCGEGTFPAGGKLYKMPCHGFARLLPWHEVSRKADKGGASVTVQLRDTPHTRELYPFGFAVNASYELSGGYLAIHYTVQSEPANTLPMMFSIGNHIAFNIPFLKGTNPADMTFETPSAIQLLRNAKGVLSGEQKSRSFDTPTKLGDFDVLTAMPLAGYKSQPWARLVDPQGLALRITQQATSVPGEPLVRFNIFGGPKVGYFSPEPWLGIQNSLNLGKGSVQLAPGGNWQWRLELRTEAAAPLISAASQGVERVAVDFGFVEGPIWSKDGFLIFSDIYGSRIYKTSPSGKAEIYRNFSNAGNGNALDSQGRLYTAERDGRRVSRVDQSGAVTVVAAEWEGKRLNSPNDIVVRRDGHVYFTDPASKAVLEQQELGFSGVYHVTPSGQISLVTREMNRPNGVALTPDGRTLYVADSENGKIVAFNLDAQGNTSGQRVLIEKVDGTPDGLRVAANGNIYTSCRGICVYSPAGQFIRKIDFPETPTNCAFGDSDLSTLYVTARTSVYRVRIPDKGSLQY